MPGIASIAPNALGSLVIVPIVEIEIPAIAAGLDPDEHEQLAKRALGTTLREHHRKHMRGHFEPAARFKYQHFPRSIKYTHSKRKYTGIDIDNVLTGDSRRLMVAPKNAKVSGSAAGGTLSATIFLRFAFRGGRSGVRRFLKVSRQSITLAKQILELERFTEDESRDAAARFLELYARGLKNLGRKKIRLNRDAILERYLFPGRGGGGA